MYLNDPAVHSQPGQGRPCMLRNYGSTGVVIEYMQVPFIETQHSIYSRTPLLASPLLA